jgi:hypothetical protein
MQQLSKKAMLNIENKFYVYIICDPREKYKTEFCEFRPIYIGKGSGDRWFIHIKEAKGICKPRGKNFIKQNWIKSIIEDGYEPIVVFAKQGLDNDAAYELETSLIKRFGRINIDTTGLLTNRAVDQKTLGGGVKGMKHTKKRVITIPKELRKPRKKVSESTKAIWKLQRTGRKAKKSTKELMSSQRIGSKNSNALKWEITTPSGDKFIVNGGLKTWCVENGLSFQQVYFSTKGFKTIKHGQGNGGPGRKKQ